MILQADSDIRFVTVDLKLPTVKGQSGMCRSVSARCHKHLQQRHVEEERTMFYNVLQATMTV